MKQPSLYTLAIVLSICSMGAGAFFGATIAQGKSEGWVFLVVTIVFQMLHRVTISALKEIYENK